MAGILSDNDDVIRRFVAELLRPVRPRVFTSYHHGVDEFYYDLLSTYYADENELIHDASLDERIDSDDVDYVRWTIRDECIRGSSCTVVLCGAETPERKYVDWEVKATLDMEHGLVAIGLPGVRRDFWNRIIVPDRVNDNIQSGFAVWLPDWNTITTASFAAAIADARARAKVCKHLIHNWREPKSRNG